MSGAALKNPAELPSRLGLTGPAALLIVDAPDELGDLLRSSRPKEAETILVESRELSGVKQRFDAILLWREDRIGSRAALESAVKRLEPPGVLWVVTAMKKVRGPRTPAVHRLELPDLVKGLVRSGLVHDDDVRVTSWHVAHRFVRGEPPT
jgi:hypothetical protein